MLSAECLFAFHANKKPADMRLAFSVAKIVLYRAQCHEQCGKSTRGWRHQTIARCQTFGAFSLLQRLPVVSIGPIRWLAGRDHRNPERNVYPSPDCRYASGCTLPDNLPVIPCACRAGMRLVLLVTGVDSAELRRDQLGSCPGSFLTERREVPLRYIFTSMRGYGRPTPFQLRLRSAARAAGFAQTRYSRFSKRPPLHTEKHCC
jgi:hypothetical protein